MQKKKNWSNKKKVYSKFNEKKFQYDKNSNIQKLSQYGKKIFHAYLYHTVGHLGSRRDFPNK